MRLLEDENGQPRLFVERVYSVNPNTAIAKAIIGLAKQKADKMNTAVFSQETKWWNNDEEDESPPVQASESVKKNTTTLKGCGGRSPVVYSDAGGGLIKPEKLVVSGYKI